MSKPEAGRKVGEREALAIATTVRGSPYKLNLVAGLIRGRKAEDAVTLLTDEERPLVFGKDGHLEFSQRADHEAIVKARAEAEDDR